VPRTPKITRAQILSAALDIVDEEGLGALSMRRLGQRLGVEAMSLYNHVPDKAAVLDAVHEAVLLELELPDLTGHWRTDAAALARAFRHTLIAHPHTALLFAERPAMTPGSLSHVERALEILRPRFPRLRDRIAIVQVVVAYVVGHVAQNLPQCERRHPDYATLDRQRFPNLVGIGRAVANYDVDAEFEFGLQALFRGLTPRPRAP
jgi:AcrR family transcriptional regulator